MIRRISSWIGIRHRIVFPLLLFSGISASAQVVITPSTPPVVNAGQTTTFTATVVEGGGVTWSCPGCAGSINPSTGVYTAPSVVHSNQSYGGYQILPNDHIFNTRIDSLSVDSHSAAWIAGAGSVPFSYQFSFPVNYFNGSTPAQSMLFDASPQNNGTFQFPVYPGGPSTFARQESGWWAGMRLSTRTARR